MMPPAACPFLPWLQIKVALCQLAVSSDKAANLATARTAIEEAAAAGVCVMQHGGPAPANSPA